MKNSSLERVLVRFWGALLNRGDDDSGAGSVGEQIPSFLSAVGLVRLLAQRITCPSEDAKQHHPFALLIDVQLGVWLLQSLTGLRDAERQLCGRRLGLIETFTLLDAFSHSLLAKGLFGGLSELPDDDLRRSLRCRHLVCWLCSGV